MQHRQEHSDLCDAAVSGTGTVSDQQDRSNQQHFTIKFQQLKLNSIGKQTPLMCIVKMIRSNNTTANKGSYILKPI